MLPCVFMNSPRFIVTRILGITVSGLDRMIRTAVYHRPWIIAFYLVLGLAMLPGVLKVRQNNSPETFFVQDATALQQYADFEFTFGRDRTLRVVLEGDGVWTSQGLTWIADFEQQAPKLRGVIAAAGLYGHHGFRFEQWPPPDPAAFRTEVLNDPLDRHAAWINEDATTVTILVALYRLSPADQQISLLEIERILDTVPHDVRASMLGLPEVNRAMDQALIDIMVVFFPLLVVLAVVLLSVCLRHPAQVLVPLLLVSICLVTPLGMMGYLGIEINLVLIILIPLLFVISLATAVHVLMCFRRYQRNGLATRAAVLETYKIKRWPVIWTGLTTGVGFGSFMLSAVPPIKNLGSLSVFAITFMTIAVLTLYPALLAGIRSGSGSDTFERWAEQRGEWWAAWSVQYSKRVFIIFALSAMVLLAGTPMLRIESNVLTYFNASHPMRAELSRIQNSGIGVMGAELVLTRPVTGDDTSSDAQPRFDLPAELNRIVALSDQIRSLDLVLGGISAGDQVHGISRYRSATEHRSETAVEEALEYMREETGKQQMLTYFLSADADQARISMLVPMLGFTSLEPLFDQALNLAKEHFPKAEILLTGQYPLVLAAQKTLLETMLISLSLTLLCIALIFRLVLGSSHLMIRALLPNVWPVVVVLGVMGWSDVPMDSTTVMIAAAILGLAVDDTLHSLGNFRRLVIDQEASQAAVTTLKRTAPAHILTSLILAAGFAAIGLSAFLPVARFGQLSALAILAALLADLLLVPALLAACSAPVLEKLKPVN